MSKASKADAWERVATEGFEGHHEKLDGGYTVGFETCLEDSDPVDLFEGLPNDRCRSAHWGYVLSGRVTFLSGDRKEPYEVVEFSPMEAFDETVGVVTENLRAAGVVEE
jgi:hypothetical protein